MRTLPNVVCGHSVTVSMGDGLQTANTRFTGTVTTMIGDALLLRCGNKEGPKTFLLALARQVVTPGTLSSPAGHSSLSAPNLGVVHRQKTKRYGLQVPVSNAPTRAPFIALNRNTNASSPSHNSSPHPSTSRGTSGVIRIAITPRETKVLEGIELALRKSYNLVKADWEGSDLKKPAVLSVLQCIQEFGLSGVRRAEPLCPKWQWHTLYGRLCAPIECVNNKSAPTSSRMTEMKPSPSLSR